MPSDGVASYTPGLSEKRGGTSRFVGSDYLGTHSKMLDAAGAVSSARQYDAFGLPTSGSDPSPFGFAGSWGYQEDAGGLKLLGHRYYDPSTGRFLTRDPIKDGRNWYAYCGNNPTTAVDPTGLYIETALDILGLVYDAVEFARKPSVANALYFVWSLAATVTPVPGSWIVRAAAAGAKHVGKRGAVLQKLMRSGFRAKLISAIGAPLGEMAAHHIIPVAMAEMVILKWGKTFPGGEAVLIEFLRNASNGMWADAAKHARLSTEYSRRLTRWLKANPNASFDDFYNFAYKTSRDLFAK